MQSPWEEIHLFVEGRVQGVGYRYSARAKAAALGLLGWVRNLPDGRVEILAQGTPDSLNAFVQWCREGPRLSQVTGVFIQIRRGIPKPNRAEFEIR